MEANRILPSSWEQTIIAVEGIGLNDKPGFSNQTLPLSPSSSSSGAPSFSQMSFTISSDDGESGTAGGDAQNGDSVDGMSLQNGQNSDEGDTIKTSALQVKIEAALARTFGLTQEALEKMLR